MRCVLKGAAWGVAGLVLVLVLLLAPVGYVETFCRGSAEPRGFVSRLAPSDRRPEANSYLTYPEWHIVFAYDGLAEVLKRGDEHRFGYLAAIRDFWVADCALTRAADRRGGADADTRIMIVTIGVSFTLEMLLKAGWEESIGRIAAWWRGPDKSPQDLVARDMAVDYAAFLRHTPWYSYAFAPWRKALWGAPMPDRVRGWERRLALGAEWSAKAAYARLIANAAGAGTPAPLTIRSRIAAVSPDRLTAIKDVMVISSDAEGVVIETPRYARFTRLLAEIAAAGGRFEEIAGNDRVMVSAIVAPGGASPVPGEVLLRLPREGFASERLLVAVAVPDLAATLRATPLGDPGIEHVFDY